MICMKIYNNQHRRCLSYGLVYKNYESFIITWIKLLFLLLCANKYKKS